MFLITLLMQKMVSQHGYDGKILQHQADSSINVQSKMNMGAYKTKLVMFDPYNCKYVVDEKTADEVCREKESKTCWKRITCIQ